MYFLKSDSNILHNSRRTISNIFFTLHDVFKHDFKLYGNSVSLFVTNSAEINVPKILLEYRILYILI